MLLVGQALIRQALLDAAGRRVLRALGMTRGALVGLAAARALAVALPAAVLAVLVAYALSPLAPIGWARELEPDPGLSFDASIVLAGGILVLATMLLAGVLAGAWAIRPERPRDDRRRCAAALARAELPPAVAAGLRMALVRRGAAAGVPVRTTLAAAVVAVVRRRHGAGLRREPAAPARHAAAVRADLGLRDIGCGGRRCGSRRPAGTHDRPGRRGRGHRRRSGPWRSDGRTTTAYAMDDVKGAIVPTVLSGRAPRTPDEVLVGHQTARRLGLELGDVGRGR